jgi:hypothetical protein
MLNPKSGGQRMLEYRLVIRMLKRRDIRLIPAAFADPGLNTPVSQGKNYFSSPSGRGY